MPVCAQVCVEVPGEKDLWALLSGHALCHSAPATLWLGERHMANEAVWRWIRGLIISDRKALRCV